MRGKHSRRINVQHRLVYEADEENKVVRVLQDRLRRETVYGLFLFLQQAVRQEPPRLT